MRLLPRVSENNRDVRCARSRCVSASSTSMTWMAAAFGEGFDVSIWLRLGPMPGKNPAQPHIESVASAAPAE
jgi:hypothetical protein